MRIQYASDLHLEFPENRYFLDNHPLQPQGDVLLLGGDILQFKSQAAHNYFFDELSEKFKVTYWIPGNHEYYGYNLNNKSGSFCEPIRDNVFLVNDYAVTLEGVRFIFSTLWTKISSSRRRDVERGMNDFRLIRFGNYPLDTDIYNTLHQQSLEFIRLELQNQAGPTVVMAHHVPTLQHYPPEYVGSVINQGFAVDLDRLIETSANQLGYVAGNEHLLFDNGAYFELLCKL